MTNVYRIRRRSFGHLWPRLFELFQRLDKQRIEKADQVTAIQLSLKDEYLKLNCLRKGYNFKMSTIAWILIYLAITYQGNIFAGKFEDLTSIICTWLRKLCQSNLRSPSQYGNLQTLGSLYSNAFIKAREAWCGIASRGGGGFYRMGMVWILETRSENGYEF